MKRTTTRALSFVIVLAIVVSLFAGMLTTSAAGYTANWGKRGQVATSPSSKASSYYTGNYSYATAVGLFNSLFNFILLVAVNAFSRKVSEISLW